MSVGNLLLKSFWTNETVSQLYDAGIYLFLLFKFDRLILQEYRQQIKTNTCSLPVELSGLQKHDFKAGHLIIRIRMSIYDMRVGKPESHSRILQFGLLKSRGLFYMRILVVAIAAILRQSD